MMDDTEMEALAMSLDGSSLGDAASGRRQWSVSNEDDEIYYIPERRPSLDLGQSLIDTSHWVQLDRQDSYSSCYSVDSDNCENIILRAKSEDDAVSETSDTPQSIHTTNEFTSTSLTVAFTFKAICKTLGKMTEGALRTFKMVLWQRYPQSFNTPPQDMDLVDLVDRLLEFYNLDMSLQITKTVLEDMGQKKMVAYLQTLCLRNEMRHDLSETLKRTYSEVCEDVDMQEKKRPFDDVYTNLYISSTCDNGPNIEHEVMTIEKLNSNQEAEIRLSTKDIFTPEMLERSNTKITLLTGPAGSGKSMAVRRELKQFEGSQLSLLQIIQKLYPETEKLRHEDYRSEDCKILLVFDGLDEYNGVLDFENTGLVSDVTDLTTLNAIVVNLLRGKLFNHGLFLITSRPQVKFRIPWDTHYLEIEVRGFCDRERDEYFHRRFTDPNQAARVIAHIKTFKTLGIMCHLPLFCSLVADECHHMFREQGTGAELPRSITYMYTKLVLLLTRQRRTFRAPDSSPDKERDFLMQLGKLAFDMLEQGQFQMTKLDWKDTGIDEKEAVNNSGLCTQYLIKPNVLFLEEVLSFVHPTVQEYLAALYVFLSFTNQGKNIFEQHLTKKLMGLFKGQRVMELYKSAVDRSLLCADGKLDISLRFLFGMVHETNLELLRPLCTSAKWPTVIEDAAALIRKRIRENHFPGRNNNLQHCLEELGVLTSEAASQ
ncbi:hypothetical protein F2P81_008724 [Scophthalmus maximus]|uniref:NACHT domain-containing protein n=1 Tax=Scophthalmus maximus TaxID=52904 RepID=A0A6A4T2H5_SCOMX|nr:hypothetical protein F2P81_008724 [Scophthalmus maximus]